MADDFLPHQFNLFEESDLKLYHVYDSLSQTPYHPEYGIESGDINRCWMRYWHRITINALAQHLNWYQREPTSFISLYGDFQAAWDEAVRRKCPPQACDKLARTRKDRGTVYIAVISVARLAEKAVFCFSTQELVSDRMLGRGCSDVLYGKLSYKEWLAMDWIPREAVEKIITV